MNEKTMMIILLVTFVATGLLFIGLAIPMIWQKIPPNPIYGFRVAKTMNNPDVWYPANEYMGWGILWSGVLIVLVSLILFFIPGIKSTVYQIASVSTMLISVIVSLILSFRYLSTL